MAIIFGTLAVGYCSWRWHIHREIQDHLAGFKAAGCPTTPAKLDAYYTPVPAAENAATLLTNAFTKLSVADTNNPDLPLIGKGMLPGRTNGLTTAQTAAVRICLEKNAEALRLMREALERPRCRYPIQLTNGWQTLLPHLTHIVDLSRLLELEAMLATDDSEAMRSIKDLLRLEATLKNEPVGVSLRVRFRLRAMALRATEHLLTAHPLADASLAELEGILPRVWQTNDFSRAIAGDVTNAREFYEVRPWQIMSYIDHMGDDAPWDPDAPVKPWDLLGSLLVEPLAFQSANYLTLIETQTALYHASQLSTTERRSLIGAAMAPFPDVKKSRPSRGKIFWNRNKILAGMLLPSLAETAPKDTSSLAHLRGAALGLAIERYRNAHDGALPRTLDKLVPDYVAHLPSDPFGGEPLRFKRLKTGYAIFRLDSVIPEGEEQKKVDYEYLFVVER
jgi:hypothetical protein